MKILNKNFNIFFSVLFFISTLALIIFTIINFNFLNKNSINYSDENKKLLNEIDIKNKYIDDMQNNIESLKGKINEQKNIENIYKNMSVDVTSKQNELGNYNISPIDIMLDKNFYNSLQTSLLENSIDGLYFSTNSEKNDKFDVDTNNAIVNLIVNDYFRLEVNKKIFENNLNISNALNQLNYINNSKNFAVKSLVMNSMKNSNYLETIKNNNLENLDLKYNFYLNKELFLSSNEENKTYLANIFNNLKQESSKSKVNLTKNYKDQDILNYILQIDLLGINTLNNGVYKITETNVSQSGVNGKYKYLSDNLNNIYKVEFTGNAKHVLFYLDKNQAPVCIVDLNKYDYQKDISSEDMNILNLGKSNFK